MEKMNAEQKTITILCPVFNEEENVVHFITQFSEVVKALDRQYGFEFLFADNCSTDNTLACLVLLRQEYPNLRIIKYSRNFGVMKSIFTGIINSKSNACAVFDCDLQDPPELLLDFIKEWERGAKVVYGVRRKRDEKYVLGLFRRIFRQMEAYLKGYKVTVESGAWLLDARVVDELRGGAFEPYLSGLISRLGFKAVGVSYDRRARLRGESKFGFVRYFAYATDGLVSGTIAPLRISVISGAILSLMSFIFGLYFIFAKLFLGVPFATGVAAIIVILLFGFGLNFLFLGIIGEYLGRLHLAKESSQPAIIEESYPCLNEPRRPVA